MKPPASLPAVVERAYDLWRKLDTHLVHLPAHTRAAVGARALSTAIDLLDALLAAAYAPRGTPAHGAALDVAAQRAALLRFLLRGMRDGHHLSPAQHAHVAAMLDDVGRQTGAWRRSSR